MRKITVQKPGTVRLTSAAVALYAGSCGGIDWGGSVFTRLA